MSHPPEDVGIPHMVGSQRDSRQELVAEPVLEGAVEVGGAAVGSEHLEIPQLRLPVHQQLGFPAVHPHQQRVAHALVRVAGHQLVGDAISEELGGDRHTWVRLGIRGTPVSASQPVEKPRGNGKK